MVWSVHPLQGAGGPRPMPGARQGARRPSSTLPIAVACNGRFRAPVAAPVRRPAAALACRTSSRLPPSPHAEIGPWRQSGWARTPRYGGCARGPWESLPAQVNRPPIAKQWLVHGPRGFPSRSKRTKPLSARASVQQPVRGGGVGRLAPLRQFPVSRQGPGPDRDFQQRQARAAAIVQGPPSTAARAFAPPDFHAFGRPLVRAFSSVHEFPLPTLVWP